MCFEFFLETIAAGIYGDGVLTGGQGGAGYEDGEAGQKGRQGSSGRDGQINEYREHSFLDMFNVTGYPEFDRQRLRFYF